MLSEKKSVRNFITQGLGSFIQIITTQWIFILILAVGIFARVWHFGETPPGLNPDEASIGVEAYYIYKFGMDRNGMTYPIHLISWGSGQNALYAYLIMPLVVLRGLNVESIRLPMMLAGIFSLPLTYFAGRRIWGHKFGLLVMFLMAISPWHIVNSRWAVESNIFPFIFLLGFLCFVQTVRDSRWFTPALIFFAVSLYSYGTAYVAIPVFLLLVIPALLYFKKITLKETFTGLLIFAILALPIALFVFINIYKLDTIHIGSITIPRLPVEARYESLAAVFDKSPLAALWDNVVVMFDLLWQQEDPFVWNSVSPYGYFYKVTFPLVAIGFFFLLASFKKNKENNLERWLFLSWIVASLAIGIAHPVNLTRFNLIFTPILFCIALGLIELNKYFKYTIPAALITLSIGFVFFTQAYHYGEDYQRRASEALNAGIIPAIEFASENSETIICVTDQTRFAYIYTLYVSKLHPSEYLDSMEWLLPEFHPVDPARSPRELGPFRFKMSDCVEDPRAVYILKLKETPPNLQVDYKSRTFKNILYFYRSNLSLRSRLCRHSRGLKPRRLWTADRINFAHHS